LQQGALEVVEEFPIDGGSVADVLVGMMGNHKVAIKSYRCYSSSDRLPTYVVCRTNVWRVPCQLKVHQQRFYKEALACSCLRHQNVVPFIGMYSTPEHPLALIFDFMDHLNLGVYLRNNGNVGRLELVRFCCVIPGIHDLSASRLALRHRTRCGIYAQSQRRSRGP
jgi:hypothetical protein